jgi:hypothetical protein
MTHQILSSFSEGASNLSQVLNQGPIQFVSLKLLSRRIYYLCPGGIKYRVCHSTNMIDLSLTFSFLLPSRLVIMTLLAEVKSSRGSVD